MDIALFYGKDVLPKWYNQHIANEARAEEERRVRSSQGPPVVIPPKPTPANAPPGL